MELDVFEADGAVNCFWLESRWISRVDGRDTVDRGEELGSSTAGFDDGLDLWREHGEGERTDENGEEDVDDDTDVGSTLGHKDCTVVARVSILRIK